MHLLNETVHLDSKFSLWTRIFTGSTFKTMFSEQYRMRTVTCTVLNSVPHSYTFNEACPYLDYKRC